MTRVDSGTGQDGVLRVTTSTVEAEDWSSRPARAVTPQQQAALDLDEY